MIRMAGWNPPSESSWVTAGWGGAVDGGKAEHLNRLDKRVDRNPMKFNTGKDFCTWDGITPCTSAGVGLGSSTGKGPGVGHGGQVNSKPLRWSTPH